MRVRQCDICGITEKDITDHARIISMCHFKVTTVLGVLSGVRDFDLCSKCLDKIEELRKGERDNNEAD